MEKTIVYIDGEAGTTGLKILSRLESRADVELLKIPADLRKDLPERKRLLNSAQFVFLCLPDDAAREAVGLIDEPKVRVIDASTAHRTHPDWAYGFPELSREHEQAICGSKRVCVPGCYATGFIALTRPLVESGLIPADFPIYCHAVSGYSGGGKATIAQYESDSRGEEYSGARLYALSQEHKHLREMQYHSGLSTTPMFNPFIDDFYSGMTVNIPIITRTLPQKITSCDIINIYKNRYTNGRVKVIEGYDQPFLAANALCGSDVMELYVFKDPRDERILLTARLDNLGKGASGAAVQCFDLMRS